MSTIEEQPNQRQVTVHPSMESDDVFHMTMLPALLEQMFSF